jgi:hypothetical protein
VIANQPKSAYYLFCELWNCTKGASDRRAETLVGIRKNTDEGVPGVVIVASSRFVDLSISSNRLLGATDTFHKPGTLTANLLPNWNISMLEKKERSG